jgi:hypothetical protein
MRQRGIRPLMVLNTGNCSKAMVTRLLDTPEKQREQSYLFMGIPVKRR